MTETIGDRLPGAIRRMQGFLGGPLATQLPENLRHDLIALLVSAKASAETQAAINVWSVAIRALVTISGGKMVITNAEIAKIDPTLVLHHRQDVPGDAQVWELRKPTNG